MREDADEIPAQDVGVGSHALSADFRHSDTTSGTPLAPGAPAAVGKPNWRVLVALGAAVAALLAVYSLGKSGSPASQASPVSPADAPASATEIPTDVPTPAPTPTPLPTPSVVDLLGEGIVLADFELGNRSRAVIWCRESVPGTQIASTLALIQIASSIQFGDQVVLYEELTKPAIPGASARRGRVLETEGLGTSNFASEPTEPSEPDIDLTPRPRGEECARCAPDRVQLADTDVLVGSCIHGVPFGVGIVYVIAPPVRPGQTPLALHVSCGITTVEVQGDQIVIAGEAPLVRGLHEAVFPHPAISFERTGGRFVASDLGLLDWNCDVERSSQLDGRHLLRTEPGRSISFERVESSIGEIGVHGPMVLGLTTEQCSRLTRAWWGQPDLEEPTGSPIADLVGLEPPAELRDWFYSCHRI